MQQHRANCVCPQGTQGDPLISCISGLCQYNEDCADHEACDRLNRVCRPVCDDQSCGKNAMCHGRKHQPTCTCRDGTVGNPFVECNTQRDPPKPDCTIDTECASQLACINQRCENPCARSQICSRDQTCTVSDTNPLRTLICKCPVDMVADANGNCKPIAVGEPGCKSNFDCPDSDICVRGSCSLACKVEPCGINAQCLSQNHRGQCSCARGYEGNPLKECSLITFRQPTRECTTNDDCPFDRSCKNEKCVNPCSYSCGSNFCHVENHQAICRCPDGYIGSPETSCTPIKTPTVGCKSSDECSRAESCVNQRCISPCNCGQNAECHVTNHYPVCTCKSGYSGNALYGCFKLGCESDSQCNDDKTCYNNECLNPCSLNDHCAVSAVCYATNHKAACKCPPGLEGNPLQKCERAECYADYECPNDRACLNKHCVNPCAISNKDICASNAICFVNNHQANCKCPEHLPQGNPFSYCEKIIVINEPECQVDVDCPGQFACISNTCVNPCKELTPCTSSSKCSVLDSLPVRTMICTCPELYVPDNNGECRRMELPKQPGCAVNSECPDIEACINGQCRNPCNCGENSICSVRSHVATCSCDNGYEGNPNIACRTVGCRSNSECDADKSCINSNCINPCLVNDPCGNNAECYARDNQAQCRCLNGYRGNPRTSCHIVGCMSNNDCPSEKRCVNEQCIDPCIYENTCSPRAECKASNHMAVCKCPPGLVGNPYIDCRPEIQPQCVYDTDCHSTLACIDSKCKDPCIALEPCSLPSRCQVIPSSPVRTMICICPEGYISSGSGTCKPIESIKVIGCIADSDCSIDTSCINSLCRNPCNCGPNAQCRIKEHKPVCTCEQGYDGNPEISCTKIGCSSDSECSGTHSCINRQCVPVCSAETCGDNAECFGIHHRSICECPSGLSGDPKLSCILLGCRSDSECPLDKACINSKCENPCEKTASCSINEICNVYHHRPECACPPGYVPDPEKGCNVYDEICHYDGECPSQTACIGGECVNPCNATQPCGVNSICKVLDTLPVRTMVCECLPGYQGNAAVQCDRSK